ncbi:hypothetical protein L210DRAFT_3524691 [Boletus edulis BED1]|uniref:Uncharacterized protein n=1 Tax=Boletus edulis BED1 TaxID=1328754 RepID=A0AAD4BBB8_BOLED|nr:hypothetical protein L210DRAFT_3585896 [Boletus edulis BED1]KAF8449375.1 hypothetical protein L210DRAFT_3524691 [Boletus edulis BED1]
MFGARQWRPHTLQPARMINGVAPVPSVGCFATLPNRRAFPVSLRECCGLQG